MSVMADGILCHLVLVNLLLAVTGQQTVTLKQPRHLAVYSDNNTEIVYVGAVDHLYQLNADLSLVQNDSAVGGANQVLVVDGRHKQLIVCGGTQGTCKTLKLTNISVNANNASNNQQVVSPKSDVSTVAFVGPGLYGDDVLYVGTYDTSLSPFCGIISRSLSTNPFSETYSNMDLVGDPFGTHVLHGTNYGVNYVNYVSGFSLNGYSYFLSTAAGVSRLAQVCQAANSYDRSYVEMNLTCQSATRSYNLIQSSTIIQPGSLLAGSIGLTVDDYILLATFYSASHSASALCIYRLQDIRKRFAENLQLCYYNGSGIQFTPTSSKKCATFQMTFTESFCMTTDDPKNTPLIGSLALDACMVKEFFNDKLTAVKATSVDNHTVAFLGTDSGRLLKVRLNDNSSNIAPEYGSVNLSSTIKQDIWFSSNNRQLYVMTSDSVYKLPVSDNYKYNMCYDCLNAMDPFSGWCTLESRCVERTECANASLDNRWQSQLTGPFNRCINITSLEPSHLYSVHNKTNLTLHTVAVPTLQPGESYICVFGADDCWSNVSLSANIITCLAPAKLPQLETDVDHMDINLTVRVQPYAVDILQQNMTVYNCTTLSTCSSCSGSRWQCRWCPHQNLCVDGMSTCVNSIVSNNSCPRLISSSAETLIPAGFFRQLMINATNLPSPRTDEEGFVCHLVVESREILIPASRNSSETVICGNYSFSSNSNQSQPASLTVRWNNGFTIEGFINVTVFNCSSMSAGDCSRCRSADVVPSKFGCNWCDNRCQTMCTSSACPSPVIHLIDPRSGLIDGGTLLTITGTNLGSEFNQVKNAVTVAGVPCIAPDEDEYKNETKYISYRIVCRTGSSDSILSGSVIVNISGLTATSTNLFSYKNPHLLGISPQIGPVGGGTNITIAGTQLDAGRTRQVLLGSHNCTLISEMSNDTQLVCKTSNVTNATIINSAVVIFDGDVNRTLPAKFIYADDPQIIDVNPREMFRNGGCEITVIGSNLNISVLLLYLNGTDGTHAIQPNVSNNTHSSYYSPYIAAPSNYNISFHMDNVIAFPPTDKGVYRALDNPVLSNFTDGIKEIQAEFLILQGRGLNVECMSDKSKLSVLIGAEHCNVTVVLNDQIQCNLPPGYNDRNQLDAKVRVHVGNLSFEDIGVLQYKVVTPSGLSPAAKIGIGVGIGVGLGIALIIAAIFFIVFFRKYQRSRGEYRRLLDELNRLESTVRDQCKQAFTDLQTEISDLTGDVGDAGVPFLDYQTYTMQLLFPSVSDHSGLIKTIRKVDTINVDMDKQQIHQFHQILCSKYFLLVFVRTLEASHTDFPLPDKAKIASLLTVFLLDKMDYALEIIKILLEELIARSVEKNTQKLMLRRMESVVEKLLANWLSVCMYDYLRHHAPGRSLFTLYQAVKHQTQKGPIDAISGEARYSLAENRLLREHTEAKQLKIRVRVVDAEDGDEVMCTMLDCDTITQATDKALDAIYSNRPYSKRPTVMDSELYWKTGREALSTVCLHDEDSTTKIEDGWKQINTLSHYNVQDNAIFIVVTRSIDAAERNEDNPNIVHNYHGVVCLETGMGKRGAITVQNSQDYVWHLVKHSSSNAENGQQGKTLISEIFLTRLLTTKMTLQQFIDDLFKKILTVDESLPVAVKFLFDFFDNAAQKHGITDPLVVHAWKSNCLPLRFWVNVITNPSFVFDVNKSDAVDSCLSVIASAFMDSCSSAEQKLTKDSPSAKLLFAKDVPEYRRLFTKFYQDIHDQPSIADSVMTQRMLEMSKVNMTEFNLDSTVNEIFRYAQKFQYELRDALDEDPSTKKLQLSKSFDQIFRVSNARSLE